MHPASKNKGWGLRLETRKQPYISRKQPLLILGTNLALPGLAGGIFMSDAKVILQEPKFQLSDEAKNILAEAPMNKGMKIEVDFAFERQTDITINRPAPAPKFDK